jgi:hypothetical protein
VTKGQQLELMAGHDRTSLAILPNVSTR